MRESSTAAHNCVSTAKRYQSHIQRPMRSQKRPLHTVTTITHTQWQPLAHSVTRAQSLARESHVDSTAPRTPMKRPRDSNTKLSSARRAGTPARGSPRNIARSGFKAGLLPSRLETMFPRSHCGAGPIMAQHRCALCVCAIFRLRTANPPVPWWKRALGCWGRGRGGTWTRGGGRWGAPELSRCSGVQQELVPRPGGSQAWEEPRLLAPSSLCGFTGVRLHFPPALAARAGWRPLSASSLIGQVHGPLRWVRRGLRPPEIADVLHSLLCVPFFYFYFFCKSERKSCFMRFSESCKTPEDLEPLV